MIRRPRTLRLCVLFFAACLMTPAAALATGGGGGGGGGGGSDGSGKGTYGGSYSSNGPSIPPYTIGIEGMPVIDPEYGGYYGAPKKKNQTKAQEDWKEKALATLGKYIKGKVEDHLKKKLGFPPILPPPLQVAKEAYDDITTGIEITKDVLDTVEAARKAFRDPYTKAAAGAYGSNTTGTTPDGTPSSTPGDMNPNCPGYESMGGGGPQNPEDSNFLM